MAFRRPSGAAHWTEKVGPQGVLYDFDDEVFRVPPGFRHRLAGEIPFPRERLAFLLQEIFVTGHSLYGDVQFRRRAIEGNELVSFLLITPGGVVSGFFYMSGLEQLVTMHCKDKQNKN